MPFKECKMKTYAKLMTIGILAFGLNAGAAPAATLSFSALPATGGADSFFTSSFGDVVENSALNTADRVGPWPDGTVPYTSVREGFVEYRFGPDLQTMLTFD
jgi:hypothetical protein